MPADIQIRPDYTVYEPKEQRIYPIPEPDWDRLKRLIRRISPRDQLWQNLASACFGVCGSAILTFIGFLTASGLPTWVFPTTGAVAISGGILGAAFLKFDSQIEEYQRASSKDVIEEIELIEERYERPTDDSSLKEAKEQLVKSFLRGYDKAAAEKAEMRRNRAIWKEKEEGE